MYPKPGQHLDFETGCILCIEGKWKLQRLHSAHDLYFCLDTRPSQCTIGGEHQPFTDIESGASLSGRGIQGGGQNNANKMKNKGDKTKQSSLEKIQKTQKNKNKSTVFGGPSTSEFLKQGYDYSDIHFTGEDDVPGDGTCLFHSVVKCVPNLLRARNWPLDGHFLRQQCALWLEIDQNAKFFEPLLGTFQTTRLELINKLRNPAVYCGELAIFIMCNMLHIALSTKTSECVLRMI